MDDNNTNKQLARNVDLQKIYFSDTLFHEGWQQANNKLLSTDIDLLIWLRFWQVQYLFIYNNYKYPGNSNNLERHVYKKATYLGLGHVWTQI